LADQAVTILIILNVILIGLLIVRPSLTKVRGGKILAFVALFLLPLAALGLASTVHLEDAKSTTFCLSCHTMEPYGKSLRIDDPTYIPAAHFQNNRIPRDAACYTCHTNYTMFGGMKAKLGGLKHLYIYYFGKVPEKIALYEPYTNRECLHCHAGARSFEETSPHQEMREQLGSNDMSCLTCHNKIHDAQNASHFKIWKER
jgi:nitrate/TMAO reductase-like tetraheme cytochrome c subunit